MSANYSDKYRHNLITLTNSQVSSGNYSGTNALDGSAGLANGRTVGRFLHVYAVGDTVENIIRVYRKTGSTYCWQFNITVPAWTVSLKGQPWNGGKIPIEIELPGTTYLLAYNMEANEADLRIEEIVEDFQ